ncbi:MAG: DNA-binding response regulator [Gallionellaceae bacterium]
MQQITVAISDQNVGRCAKFEHLLQYEQGIQILVNAKSNEDDMIRDRRLMPRINITAAEDMVARICRLKPRVLFANIKQCIEADCAMLMTLRHECPDTLVVLLADESVQEEDQVLRALASGARGYLDLEAESSNLSKAVRVIDRGEAWVPRKMLGKIMDQVSQWCQISSGGHLDPAS